MGDFELFRQLMGQQVTSEHAKRLYWHFLLLRKWNSKLNLTTVVDLSEAAGRHYGECLYLAARLPEGRATVADVGSGAGFPGIPIAVTRPDLPVTLLEANQKKVAFLKEATRDLANVRVVAARAESLKEEFDWVTLRAVRWDRDFVRLGKKFALLVGEKDVEGIRKVAPVVWDEPLRVPGSRERVLLIGRT